jgi:hypothetical protein
MGGTCDRAAQSLSWEYSTSGRQLDWSAADLLLHADDVEPKAQMDSIDPTNPTDPMDTMEGLSAADMLLDAGVCDRYHGTHSVYDTDGLYPSSMSNA